MSSPAKTLARGAIALALSTALILLGAAGAAARHDGHIAPARANTPARARVTAAHAPARAHASAGAAVDTNGLAPTPYMGWDTYFAFGARYSEASVLEQASLLYQSGLEHDGYDIVWLDVGWWQGARAANGQIELNGSQWPHGMRWLTETLHSYGLRVGLYTDAGREGCGGAHEGSYGHYQQDVNTFAAWGIDAVKVDFCGGVRQSLSPKSAYTSFHNAIAHNSSRRPMLLSICDYLEPGQLSGKPAFGGSAFASYSFGPGVGNSWRTDTDVGSPGYVTFPTVLRNLDADATHPEAAGPGHWNDPDYLGPDQGMNANQFRVQLSMWAILAAPLMISDDLTKLSPASLEAVSNREVIAVDQDPAGIQGTLVSSSGNAQVWSKPLSDGSRAVALLNRGSTPLRISTSAGAVGVAHAPSYALRDLWTHVSTTGAGPIAAEVPGESVVLLRVTPR